MLFEKRIVHETIKQLTVWIIFGSWSYKVE